MNNTSLRARPIWGRVLIVLAILAFPCLSINPALASARASTDPQQLQPGVSGPIGGESAAPAVFNGSLLDVAAKPGNKAELSSPQPLKHTPNDPPKGSAPALVNWKDPVAQTTFGLGDSLMPSPNSFAGIDFASGGSGWPPDTNGDVGPTYYIQTVNTSMAIFNKTTGAKVVQLTYDAFFNIPGNAACDSRNDGDPVVVYDRFANRWLITDFSVRSPYYECIAISKTGDPVAGGWYFYSLSISVSNLNDYPKLGVWRDWYVLTFNMFTPVGGSYNWNGVEVWALQKSRMLTGGSLKYVIYDNISYFPPSTGYASLLPAHALTEPAAGTPSYLATVNSPNQVLVWKILPNFSSPNLSSFSGPTVITVAPFAAAPSIPERDYPANLLDSLSPRPMMQLVFRNAGGAEALWLTHTVANQGISGMRWYELRTLSGTPSLYQQGTYQPDSNYRWMGSLSVDQDGNMALGYSISNTGMYPGIRYSGRLNGETLGQLPQGESTLFNGTGSQFVSGSPGGTVRWGDYSAMSVDPSDDCTFYYTTEYYAANGSDWQTRIGYFKYPSCGQPKGYITGVVRNSVTNLPVPNTPVLAQSGDQKMTVLTNDFGQYTIYLAAGSFAMTAGPLTPGYPTPATASGVALVAGNTTTQDFYLTPTPNLVSAAENVNDLPPGGNQNGHPEPGETAIQLYEPLNNTGATTATNITAHLTTSTAGVTVTNADATYPDVAAGATASNTTPFEFRVGSGVACGTDLNFSKKVIDQTKTYTITFTINASAPAAPANLFSNDVESGAAGWTTGAIVGSPNTWAITTEQAYSPTHSWTDSPGGQYLANTTSWVRTPAFNLSGVRHTKISFHTRYDLEAGYDYVYLDYSLDGGTNWSNDGQALAILNGTQTTWQLIEVSTPMLDEHSNVALRFRLVSDAGVQADGVYLDDITLSYVPFYCLWGQILQYLPWVR